MTSTTQLENIQRYVLDIEEEAIFFSMNAKTRYENDMAYLEWGTVIWMQMVFAYKMIFAQKKKRDVQLYQLTLITKFCLSQNGDDYPCCRL